MILLCFKRLLILILSSDSHCKSCSLFVFPRVSTLNIDAVGGSDYSSIGDRQITFSPGDPTFQSVDVTINDDAIVENNERFTATLTAENGVNIRPDGATTTVTIVDNDGGYTIMLNYESIVNSDSHACDSDP